MIGLLKRYLIQNKKLTLPGIGTIKMEMVPAISEFSEKQILPPQFKWKFSGDNPETDVQLVKYISKSRHIPEEKARDEWNNFLYKTQTELQEGKAFEIPGILKIKKEGLGFAIEEDQQTVAFFDPVIAEKIIRLHSEHTLKSGDVEMTNLQMEELLSDRDTVKKNNWQLVALLIFAAGLLLFFLYLANNNWHLQTGL